MISIQSLAELSSLIREVRQATAIFSQVGQITEALHLIAQSLKEETDTILEANTLDLEASLEMAVPELIIDWLKLTPERLNAAITIVEHLMRTEPYISSCPQALGLAAPRHVHTYTLRAPLGVVALVYEALPELAIIAAALCLSTGNGLILKGGHEASQTNQAIADVFQRALARAKLPEHLILAISPSEGEAARRWLMQTPDLDLLIPYGRASLVQKVVKEAISPTLSTAIGNCYLYWANRVPPEVVAHIIIDSQKGTPEPVNSIEKVLVNEKVAPNALDELKHLLHKANLTIEEATAPSTLNYAAEATDLWYQAHLNHTITLCSVPDVTTAIALINEYSYGHTSCIVTSSYRESMQFISQAQTAMTYVNTSPRFQRNAIHSSDIALGMSSQRRAQSGRITASSLTRCKTIINGLR